MNRIVFSYEYPFCTNGVVNKYDARFGRTMNLQTVEKFPLRSKKFMIRCARNESRIEVSYFFSEPSITGSK